MPKKLLISLTVGGLISTLTLYLAFRNVPLGELSDYLRTINYWWIIPSLVIIAAAFVLRAVRWIIILKNICNVTFWQAFHPTMIGFMMNCVLPGRVGELARPILLKRERRVPMATGLATIAAERIFDLFILITLFALLFSTIANHPNLAGDYFGIYLDSHIIKSVAMGLIRLCFVFVAFIAALSIRPTRRIIKNIIAAIGQFVCRIFPRLKDRIQRITTLIHKIIDNFAIGLSLIRNPPRLFACIGITLVIWTLTAISYLVFAMGCPGISLSLIELTTVMVIISFVIALPSVPGFWGLWEAGGVFALALFGIAEKDALGFTLISHATQIFLPIGIGLVSALITSVNIFHLSQTDSIINRQPRSHGE